MKITNNINENIFKDFLWETFFFIFFSLVNCILNGNFLIKFDKKLELNKFKNLEYSIKRK